MTHALEKYIARGGKELLPNDENFQYPLGSILAWVRPGPGGEGRIRTLEEVSRENGLATGLVSGPIAWIQSLPS